VIRHCGSCGCCYCGGGAVVVSSALVVVGQGVVRQIWLALVGGGSTGCEGGSSER